MIDIEHKAVQMLPNQDHLNSGGRLGIVVGSVRDYPPLKAYLVDVWNPAGACYTMLVPYNEVVMCPNNTCEYGSDGKCLKCGFHRPARKS